MNKVNEISRRTLFYLLILLPLIVIPIFSSPFELLKTSISGLIISILGCYYFFNYKILEIKLPNKNIIIFFFISLITSFFSIDFINSIFSSYPRFTEGDILNLTIFFLLILVLNSFEKINLLKIQLYSSFPIAVIGIIESLFTNQRIHSTFSQANFFGVFLALTILYLILNIENFNSKQKLFYKIYIFILLFLIIKTASITSIISLITVLLLLILKKEIKFKLKNFFKYFAVLSIIFILSGSILLPKIKDIYFQLKDRNQTTISDSFLIRSAVWETTINLSFNNIKSSFLGYGSNTFIEEFEKNRNPKLDNYSEYYLFFDKPHNYYLEILFSNGLVSLLLFIHLIYQTYKSSSVYRSYILLIALFIFFNWLDWYLKIFFFIIMALSLKKENLKIKYINYIFSFMCLVIFFYFALVLTSDFLYKKGDFDLASNLNPTNKNYLIKSSNLPKNFFYKQNDPLLLVEGLKYYKDNDLIEYKKFLEDKYKNNLPIKLHINSD